MHIIQYKSMLHEQLCWCVTGEIVDVASIQQQVSINWVTHWGQVTRQGHAGPHITPQTACDTNKSTELQWQDWSTMDHDTKFETRVRS